MFDQDGELFPCLNGEMELNGDADKLSFGYRRNDNTVDIYFLSDAGDGIVIGFKSNGITMYRYPSWEILKQWL